MPQKIMELYTLILLFLHEDEDKISMQFLKKLSLKNSHVNDFILYNCIQKDSHYSLNNENIVGGQSFN